MFNKKEFKGDTDRMLDGLKKLIKNTTSIEEKERLQEVLNKTTEWQKPLL